MLSTFHFACDRCGFAVDRKYWPRVYLLPDEHEVTMPQRHVWCERCATVTPAESLEWEDARTLPNQAAARNAWRALRTRPTRCLRCGTSVPVPDSEWTNLSHPPCGGTLRATATLVGGTEARYRAHRYSIEGDLLEQGAWFYGYSGEPDAPIDLW